MNKSESQPTPTEPESNEQPQPAQPEPYILKIKRNHLPGIQNRKFYQHLTPEMKEIYSEILKKKSFCDERRSLLARVLTKLEEDDSPRTLAYLVPVARGLIHDIHKEEGTEDDETEAAIQALTRKKKK